MKNKTLMISLAVLLFFLALGFTLYPLIANQYNQRHQSQIHTAYQEQIAQADDAEINAIREKAIAYNESLLSGIPAEDAFSNEALTGASENYGSLLNLTDSGIMGYVRIPNIAVTLPIYHGTDANTLEIGIGHLLGSSLPVGGESTHTVLTAHSGMANQKMFSDLDRLKEGDVFYLEILDEVLAYQVNAINIVLPHDTTYLGITTGEDYCTLVTCTPFGVNTHRLLVRGTRIPYEEAEQITAEITPENVVGVAMFKPKFQGIDTTPLTKADCTPLSHEDDLNGKVVVIKPEVLRREYQMATNQIKLCTGGFGAYPHSRGSACFCVDLYSGKESRFERQDILGTLEQSQLPQWAALGLEQYQNQHRQKSHKDREER